MGYDDMSYAKCIGCRFVEILYNMKGGATLYCKLTGKRFNMKHCKVYYGTGKEVKQ